VREVRPRFEEILDQRRLSTAMRAGDCDPDGALPAVSRTAFQRPTIGAPTAS
jgi:hypothetical protein